MNAPKIETVLRIYTGHTEIGTSEIKELFDCGSGAACKLKRRAKEEMAKEKVKCFMPTNVNVEVAFKVWGIDIEFYKRKYKEMQRLNLNKQA